MRCQFDSCREKVIYRVSYDIKHQEDDHFMCRRHGDSMRPLADEVVEIEQPKEIRSELCATALCKKRARSVGRKLAV